MHLHANSRSQWVQCSRIPVQAVGGQLRFTVPVHFAWSLTLLWHWHSHFEDFYRVLKFFVEAWLKDWLELVWNKFVSNPHGHPASREHATVTTSNVMPHAYACLLNITILYEHVFVGLLQTVEADYATESSGYKPVKNFFSPFKLQRGRYIRFRSCDGKFNCAKRSWTLFWQDYFF